MSVYKNTSDLVDVVHILSQAILAGDTIDTSLCCRFNVDEAFNTDIYTNGTGALTSFLASPRVIDKNNLQFFVDVGLYKWDASHRYLEWR